MKSEYEKLLKFYEDSLQEYKSIIKAMIGNQQQANLRVKEMVHIILKLEDRCESFLRIIKLREDSIADKDGYLHEVEKELARRNITLFADDK